jgi:hypothetical protein
VFAAGYLFTIKQNSDSNMGVLEIMLPIALYAISIVLLIIKDKYVMRSRKLNKLKERIHKEQPELNPEKVDRISREIAVREGKWTMLIFAAPIFLMVFILAFYLIRVYIFGTGAQLKIYY